MAFNLYIFLGKIFFKIDILCDILMYVRKREIYMNKETLKMLANKLMFTMEESEYDTLLEEFDTILKQMGLIGKIDGIENIEPMVYPFELDDVCLREDKVVDELEIDDILVNSDSNLYNQVKLPKVVE